MVYEKYNLKWHRTAFAHRFVDSGPPLMRPLYFDMSADEEVWRHPLQWMLGNDILVAPVTEPGASEWSTYLPAGDWIDAWSELAQIFAD